MGEVKTMTNSRLKRKGEMSERRDNVRGHVDKIRLLLVLLVVGSIQIGECLLSLFLDLGQVHQGYCIVMLQLRRSISLQEIGLRT